MLVAAGLVAARYCALTQRETPSRTICAQMPSISPVTETLLPLSSTVSRVPVPPAVDQTFTSVVVYLLPMIFSGLTTAAARVFAAVGLGIGACFLRCFATGGALGFGACCRGRGEVERGAEGVPAGLRLTLQLQGRAGGRRIRRGGLIGGERSCRPGGQESHRRTGYRNLHDAGADHLRARLTVPRLSMPSFSHLENHPICRDQNVIDAEESSTHPGGSHNWRPLLTYCEHGARSAACAPPTERAEIHTLTRGTPQAQRDGSTRSAGRVRTPTRIGPPAGRDASACWA